MNLFDYQLEAIKNVLPYFRGNKDVCAVLRAIGDRFNNLQAAVQYLLTSLDIREARGVYLDYAGAEVGATRDEMDYGDYFCANRLHVNVPKKFYFTTTKLNPESPLSLGDAEFMQKIFAYIGANSSCGTRNEIIAIVKTITNASKVTVHKTKKCTLRLNIMGENLVLTKNTISYISAILGDGIYLEEITINDKTS